MTTRETAVGGAPVRGRWILPAGGLAAALVLGALFGIPSSPAAGIVAVAVLGWAVAAFAAPTGLFFAGLLSLALSPQYLVPFGYTIGGFELTTWHNAVLVAAFIPFALREGVRPKPNAVLVAFAAMLVIGLTLSARLPGLSAFQSVKSFFALVLGPALFQLDLKPGSRRRALWAVAALPWISLAVGAGLQLAGVRPLFDLDWMGVSRLQGANIPPHLAELALVGMMAAAALALRRPGMTFAVLGDFGIILATGTRGSALAALAVLGAFAVVTLRARAFLRWRRFAMAGIVLAVGLLAATAVATVFRARTEAVNPADLRASVEVPRWMTRMSVNTSGRLGAWVFFFDIASADVPFGRGLGASTIANQAQVVDRAFRVPHNEYLRVLVDAGLVGLLIGVAGYALVFRRVVRGSPPALRIISWAVIVAFALDAVVANPLATQQFSVPFWMLLASFSQGGEGGTEEAHG